MQRRFISVGVKLAVATTTIIGLVSMGVFLSLSRFQLRSMVEGRAEAANEVMALFGQLVATPLIFRDDHGLDDSFAYVTKDETVLFVRVTSGEGQSSEVVKTFVRPGAVSEPLSSNAGIERHDDRLVVHELIHDSDGKTAGVATLSFSLSKELETWRQLRRHILFGSLGVAVLVIAVLVLVSRRSVVQPLGALTVAASRLEHGHQITLTPKAHDEVGLLTGAFSRMAIALQERERVISARNRDMKLVLDNVAQGFVLLDGAGKLIGERSTIADVWFGAGAVGQAFGRWVAPDERFAANFEMSWEQLVDGLMPRDLCLDLLPQKLTRNAVTFTLEYKALTDDQDALTSVMVVITDVTARLAQEASALAQQETIEVFQRLGSDRAGFMAFVADGERLVDSLRRGAALEADAHFRLVHTLKGNCAVHGVRSVAAACHDVENRLSESHDRLTSAEFEQIEGAWGAFAAQLKRFSGGERSVMEVEHALVRDLEDMITHRRPHAELSTAIARWRLMPVKVRLERLAEQARGLCERLDKGPVDVVVETDDTRLAADAHEAFWSSLVHVVRNAVDHGLEPAPERGEKGRARVTLTARTTAQGLEVVVQDDGRGIAWERLGAKAAARGLAHRTHEDLVDALFADGVSTRDQATDISGRGVGMAAVKDVVTSNGGSIVVESEPGRGTRFVFAIPLGRIQLAA